MRQSKKHYLVLAEVSDSGNNFEYLREALEYADMLAKQKRLVVAVVEVDPNASNPLARYFPLSIFDEDSEDESGTDVA
jgi:hypothetical protein